jgi:hypothetical protein
MLCPRQRHTSESAKRRARGVHPARRRRAGNARHVGPVTAWNTPCALFLKIRFLEWSEAPTSLKARGAVPLSGAAASKEREAKRGNMRASLPSCGHTDGSAACSPAHVGACRSVMTPPPQSAISALLGLTAPAGLQATFARQRL